MIPPIPSPFSLLAACLYVVIAVCSLAASLQAKRLRQMQWHRTSWMAITLLFVMLAGMRIISLEDILREDLREMLRQDGAYNDRQEIQVPIFAAIFIASASLAGVWAYRVAETVRGRRNIAVMVANGSAFLLITLFLLRIVSLHSVDALLYGPLKLNWVIDIGASLVVLGCGIQYWRIATGKA